MSSTTHRAHKETARDAGFGSFSPISVLAGVVTAYGAFAVLAAIAGAIANSLDVGTEFRTDDWASSGAVASAITAVVLFVSYLFGGYVAGRMARRASLLHGFALFVTTLVIGVIAGGIVAGLADNADLEQNLRSIGVPTTTDQISQVAIAGVVVSLLAVLLGSMIGANLGERWHTKLALRAADPAFGPTADAMEVAAAREVDSQRRLDEDPALQRDVAAARADEVAAARADEVAEVRAAEARELDLRDPDVQQERVVVVDDPAVVGSEPPRS